MARRGSRPRPHLDDKVLTAWNGLMIAAFARAARTIDGAESYLEDAQKAARFVREHLWQSSSQTLLRRYREGSSGVEGYAEDYAYLIFGLLELFQADGDPDWLEWATTLQRRQDELFCDAIDGGWFSTTGKDESVLLRLKEDYDGAEPAASSVSVMNLLVLSHLGVGGFSEKIDAHAWRVRIAARAVRAGGAYDAGCALHLSRRYAPVRHHRRPIGCTTQKRSAKSSCTAISRRPSSFRSRLRHGPESPSCSRGPRA